MIEQMMMNKIINRISSVITPGGKNNIPKSNAVVDTANNPFCIFSPEKLKEQPKNQHNS